MTEKSLYEGNFAGNNPYNMKTKRLFQFLSVLFGVIFSCSCTSSDSNKELLPECNVAYNAYNIPFSQLIQNSRPKVVVLNNMLAEKISQETLFNDVEILKKQIAKYPEFDFIFYFCTSTDNIQRIAEITKASGLNIVAIVDTEGKFRQMNGISSKIISSALIFDKKLKPHFSAVPGTRLSPFESVLRKFINKSSKE
ncbi:MAG: hypothetical protein IIW65_01310 [Alistipes sp.]|nr:hypothetical protein [Alistipes sp.]